MVARSGDSSGNVAPPSIATALGSRGVQTFRPGILAYTSVCALVPGRGRKQPDLLRGAFRRDPTFEQRRRGRRMQHTQRKKVPAAVFFASRAPLAAGFC
jgi:hypothetical protein